MKNGFATTDLEVFEFDRELSGVPPGQTSGQGYLKPGEARVYTVHGCAQIYVRQKGESSVVDQFVMPYGSFTRLEGLSAAGLTVINRIEQRLRIFRNQLLIGTVPRGDVHDDEGRWHAHVKTKTFEDLSASDVIEIRADPDLTLLTRSRSPPARTPSRSGSSATAHPSLRHRLTVSDRSPYSVAVPLRTPFVPITPERKNAAMSREIRWTAITGISLVVCFSTILAPASAQQQPTPPFAPEWGMLAGLDVFAKKGCGRCHALRGFGGGIGPDLGRIETGKSFFELGAAMWNHLPRMGAKMREVRIDRPRLSPREASDVIAFLFTAQYHDELGNPQLGEQLFADKGCVQCHEVGGKGGRVGPPLDSMKRANSPVLVAAAMWNHGPQMAEVMKAKGIPRPAFQGKEMVDLIAYVVSAAKDPGRETAQVVPGTPERGAKLFGEKRCVVCHAVAGRGAQVGPDLGRRGHHVSLTSFTALMWNHGPGMWAKMKERGIEVPKLSGQEMADILAYVYTSHYFDYAGNARRGQQAVQGKGCLGCHSVRGKGGTVSADFATSNVVRSPAGLIAGMWNHSAFMEAQAQKQEISWPILSGQELADISAYFVSLAKPSAPKPKTKQ